MYLKIKEPQQQWYTVVVFDHLASFVFNTQESQESSCKSAIVVLRHRRIRVNIKENKMYGQFLFL